MFWGQEKSVMFYNVKQTSSFFRTDWNFSYFRLIIGPSFVFIRIQRTSSRILIILCWCLHALEASSLRRCTRGQMERALVLICTCVHLDIISCLQRVRAGCHCKAVSVFKGSGSSAPLLWHRRLQQGCLSFRTRKQGACWELEGPAALVSPVGCQRTCDTERQRKGQGKMEEDKAEADVWGEETRWGTRETKQKKRQMRTMEERTQNDNKLLGSRG